MADADEVVGLSRIDRWGYLLLLLFVTIVLTIAVPVNEWTLVLDVALVSLALIIALGTARIRVRRMRMAYAAVAVALVLSFTVALTSRFVTDLNAGGLIYAILALLLLVAPPAILLRILAYKEVTGQTLAAALSAYLMIGLFFAFAYLTVNAWSLQPFFAQGPNANPADYVYMSYITMTTTGYGDFTPGTDVGRSLVVLEALIGQIFLVTTVARLVSMWGGPVRSADPRDDRTPPLRRALRTARERAAGPEDESTAPGPEGPEAVDEPAGA